MRRGTESPIWWYYPQLFPKSVEKESKDKVLSLWLHETSDPCPHPLGTCMTGENRKKQNKTKTSSAAANIPRNRFTQCSGQQEIHTNLGKEQLQTHWLCPKKSEKNPLQYEATTRISKNK